MVGSMQTPIIPIGSGQTQELIAPVQDTLIAKQNYAQGQQFILGGALFTVTKSGGISVGDTININTDVEASDNITDQIYDNTFYEDFTSELVAGANVTGTDLYAFRLGNLIVIEGRWTGNFSSTNDTIVTYPERFKPKANRQIRGNGVVANSANVYSDGYYWASVETHRIGQSASSAARGGCFTFVWTI